MFLTLIILILALAFILYFKEIHRPRNYPPGPPWKPFIGNTCDLRELSKNLGGLHLAYEYLGKKYNTNVLGLKLGSEYTVIVNSYKLVRQTLVSRDYEGRADNFFVRLRCLGARRGITCVDGPFWVEQRKFVERHLKNIGYGKKTMEDMIHQETKAILDILSKTQNEPIRFKMLVSPSVLNVLWTLVTGDNSSRDDPRILQLIKVLVKRNRVFDMNGGVLNSLPWLRFIIPEKIGYNMICDLNIQLKEFFRETINEHHKTWSKDRRDDLIYSFITEMKTNFQNENFTDYQLLAICLDLFFGGAMTTSTTADFVFLNLIMHPDVQEKCANELRENLNMNEVITYNDRFKVPYVEAMLLEVQRFHGLIPLTAPRRVLKDTVLDGYEIRKNTTVFINLHSVNFDEEYWGDPHVFRPERFINEDGKFLATDRVMNFGLGRRRCLGELLARQFIFIFISSILREFKILKAPDSEPLSDLPLPGITLTPRPYEGIVVPR